MLRKSWLWSTGHSTWPLGSEYAVMSAIFSAMCSSTSCPAANVCRFSNQFFSRSSSSGVTCRSLLTCPSSFNALAPLQ